MPFTRRHVVAGLSALPLAGLARPALAGIDLTTMGAGGARLYAVAHAPLALEVGDEVIYFDPAEQSFADVPAPTAIVITHAHGDHYNEANLVRLAGDSVPIIANADVVGKLPEALKARATAMKNGDTSTVAGLAIACGVAAAAIATSAIAGRRLIG